MDPAVAKELCFDDWNINGHDFEKYLHLLFCRWAPVFGHTGRTIYLDGKMETSYFRQPLSYRRREVD